MRTPTVCSEYLDSTLHYLEGRGITPEQLRGLLRLDVREHVSDSGRFPLRLFEIVLDAGERLLKDRYFGARAGVHCSRQAWGMVNYLGMSAANMKEAIDAVVAFSRLLIDHGDVNFESIDEDQTRLSWRVPPRQMPSRHVIEFFFTSWYRANKPLLDCWCSHREIHFQHAGPGDATEIARIIQAPVHYNSHSNAVEFDRTFLARPTQFPHPEIHESLLQIAREQLANLQLEDRVIREVMDCIIRQLPEGVPRLEDVAAELDMAPRTLQRRLSYINTNFKCLVDDARKEQSRKLIVDSSVGLLDISAELGFSDQSAFQKAFKRWFGKAPGRYRVSMQAVG
tara:strand:+ start:439 stop:1455 length:1017 start_codon:yes stop_codon:yes gene_type:complete